MPDHTPLIAHAGGVDELLMVFVPLAVLYAGWRVWERLRGGPPAGPDDSEHDDA